MTTLTIQIGNSDDKLTQASWSQFVEAIASAIAEHCTHVHFFGGSSTWVQWQNVAWVCAVDDAKLPLLGLAVIETRKRFNQDSVAWTEGATELI